MLNFWLASFSHFDMFFIVLMTINSHYDSISGLIDSEQ